ncbi:MAG: hypothetical protein DLM61_03575 [Pseudonocardiales bacterium]|nr:MAG: hypothetical protein DLM61_03575 [Pseudonocardiales bacterium]
MSRTSKGITSTAPPCSPLTALSGCEPQLRHHLRAAMHVGITGQELDEAILQTVPYAGFPPAMNAARMLDEILIDREV